MSWTYDGTAGTITPSGGTESSPELISDAIETIKAGDASKVSIVYATDGTTIVSAAIKDTQIILAQGTWVKIDDDIIIAFETTTRFSWKAETSSGANDGGALTVGKRSIIYINTNETFHEGNSEVDMTTGCSIVMEQDEYGNNPVTMMNASARHDIWTNPARAMAKVDIQGLSVHLIGGSSASFKWYMGYARNVVNLKDLRIDSSGEVFQLVNVTIDNPIVQTSSLASNAASGDARYTQVNNITYLWDSDVEFDGNIRSAKYTIKNPIWAGTGNWNGTVNWKTVNYADDPRFWIVYENNIYVLNATNSSYVENVKVRFDRTTIGTANYTSVDEHAEYFDETTDANGKVSKDLIDAYCQVSNGVDTTINDVDRFKWSCQVRDYGYLNTSQYVYEDRVYDSINGIGPKDDYIFIVPDEGVTLTETNANNLTEIDNMSDVYDVVKVSWIDGTHWDIDIPLTKSGDVLDFGTNNVYFDSSATNIFYISGSDITLKTNTSLDTTTKYSKVKANNVYFNTTKISDDSSFIGDVYIDSEQTLTNIYIDGDLYINTGVDSTLTFDNVTVTGNVYNDDISHTLTIQATNGSSLTAGDSGTGNGETNIQNIVQFSFTLLPSITNYEWRIYTVNNLGSLAGSVEIAGEETATTDNQTYSYNYLADQKIAVQIISQPANDYEENISYYILGNINQTVTINLKKDENN